MPLMVHKYHLGDFSQMLTADKNKLPKYLDFSIKTFPIDKYLLFEVDDKARAYVWAQVDAAGSCTYERRFMILPTGFTPVLQGVDTRKMVHAGSFHERKFGYVWHLYEVGS